MSKAGNTKGGAALWLCKCSCGTEKVVIGSDIRHGKSLSCGCKGSRAFVGDINRTHGQTNTRLYTTWQNMHARCNDTEAKNYGGKGVRVCDEWSRFEPFFLWAKQSGYRDDLTIERLDNSLGYFPENCSWASYKDQARHRSIVHMVSPTKSFAQLAEENNVPVSVMHNRISGGKWSIEKAATTPVKSERRILPKDEKGRFIKSPSPWRR